MHMHAPSAVLLTLLTEELSKTELAAHRCRFGFSIVFGCKVFICIIVLVGGFFLLFRGSNLTTRFFSSCTLQNDMCIYFSRVRCRCLRLGEYPQAIHLFL